VVEPFTPQPEPELPSVTKILDQFKAEQAATSHDADGDLLRPPATEVNGSTSSGFETVNPSIFDRYAQLATWADSLQPKGWTQVRPPDTATLEAWKRPNGTHPVSAKVLKANPHVIVNHSEDAGLPVGAGQKLTKPRLHALLYYGGNESAFAKDLIAGTAIGVPTVIAAALTSSPTATSNVTEVAAAEITNAELEPAAVFAEEVERVARKIRVRDAAQRKVRTEQQRDVGDLDPISLDRFLAIPDEPINYRIAGLWPSGGRIVLAAQWKVGKTTLTGNVIRALADGALFLNRFQTQPAEVTLLDFEMDPRKIGDGYVINKSNTPLTCTCSRYAARCPASTFSTPDRSQWAARIHGSDVAIFDCLRPILDALGLDENRDAGRLLMAIDELLSEAVVPEALIVHHMGHSGERSRGDSRIIDWPDAKWKLVRENPDLENSPRYFSAYGRDVYQAESLLEFNSETRRLALVGGNRKDASSTRLLEPLLEILRGSEDGMSGRQLDDAMVDAGHGRNASRDARQYAVKNGQVVTEPGKARAVIHKVNPDLGESAPVRHSAPVGVAHHAGESGGECANAPIDGARTLTTLAPVSDTESAPAGAPISDTESAPAEQAGPNPSLQCRDCGNDLRPHLQAREPAAPAMPKRQAARNEPPRNMCRLQPSTLAGRAGPDHPPVLRPRRHTTTRP
jgi:AAA domain